MGASLKVQQPRWPMPGQTLGAMEEGDVYAEASKPLRFFRGLSRPVGNVRNNGAELPLPI
jgi:hypothetical protein